MIFVGYDNTYKIYRCFNLNTKKILQELNQPKWHIAEVNKQLDGYWKKWNLRYSTMLVKAPFMELEKLSFNKINKDLT